MQFFDNFQTWLNPVFTKLESLSFNVKDAGINITDLIDFRFDIEDLRIVDMSVNQGAHLIQLEKEELVLSLKDFKGVIAANYSYVSDPPLFADIG